MYPQIRGSQVLLAALPFTSAMCCTFPAAKKKDQNRHVRTLFPLHKTKRVMSPHRCLSKEPLWLCPSKDSTSLGVFLRFPQFAPGDGPGAQQGGSFFCPPNVEIGETHSSWKRREVARFISRRAALVECLHLKTATENR